MSCNYSRNYQGDKILLANNKNFPEGLHSTIAGFVDVNETLEDCVRREILEEVNIKVKILNILIVNLGHIQIL